MNHSRALVVVDMRSRLVQTYTLTYPTKSTNPKDAKSAVCDGLSMSIGNSIETAGSYLILGIRMMGLWSVDLVLHAKACDSVTVKTFRLIIRDLIELYKRCKMFFKHLEAEDMSATTFTVVSFTSGPYACRQRGQRLAEDDNQRINDGSKELSKWIPVEHNPASDG